MRLEDANELGDGLVVEADEVEPLGADACFLEAIVHGSLGVGGVVALAGEALLLRRGHDHPVAEQARGECSPEQLADFNEEMSRWLAPASKGKVELLFEHMDFEPIVLRGETPDPSRIPSGCRFHPRCPALLDGVADRHGIRDDCLRKPLPVIPATGEHRAACWLAE